MRSPVFKKMHPEDVNIGDYFVGTVFNEKEFSNVAALMEVSRILHENDDERNKIIGFEYGVRLNGGKEQKIILQGAYLFDDSCYKAIIIKRNNAEILISDINKNCLGKTSRK